MQTAKNPEPTPEIKQQLEIVEKAHSEAVEKLAKKRKAAEAKLKRAKARILRADKDKERQAKRDKTERLLYIGDTVERSYKGTLPDWAAKNVIPEDKKYLFPEFFPEAKRPKKAKKQTPKKAEIPAG
jgi:hypothetical protein